MRACSLFREAPEGFACRRLGYLPSAKYTFCFDRRFPVHSRWITEPCQFAIGSHFSRKTSLFPLAWKMEAGLFIGL